MPPNLEYLPLFIFVLTLTYKKKKREKERQLEKHTQPTQRTFWCWRRGRPRPIRLEAAHGVVSCGTDSAVVGTSHHATGPSRHRAPVSSDRALWTRRTRAGASFCSVT